MAAFNFPEYKTVLYNLNPETGKYEKQPERVPFNKLPFELKVETTWDERIRSNGATEIITGRIKGGKRLFFTGLLPVYNSKVNFYGNDYENTPQGKRNSLVIFRFSQDNTRLSIYYFNHYYKHSPNERINFVSEFIKHKGDN
jgi:hypothetical protein